MTIPAVAAVANTPAMDAMYMNVWTSGTTTDGTLQAIWKSHVTVGGETVAYFSQSEQAPTSASATDINLATGKALGAGVEFDDTFTPINFDMKAGEFQALMATGEADGSSADDREKGMEAAADLETLMMAFACTPSTDATIRGDAMTTRSQCGSRLYNAATDELMDGSAAVKAMPTTTDPSFFQVAISYAFGDTSVGVSWYQAGDMYNEGSELTAIGAGVDHNLPKLGTNVYAAVQNYSIKDDAVGRDSDDTVVMIGARVKF